MTENVKYLILDGMDKTGKSSIVNMLKLSKKELGYDHVIVTQEPMAIFGVRDILFERRTIPLSTASDLMLFYADRLYKAKVVMTELKNINPKDRTLVISDRSFLSSYAYQGDNMIEIHNTVKNDLLYNQLNTTAVIIDISTDTLFNRMHKSIESDRFEETAHYNTVRKRFKRSLDIFKFNDSKIINGEKSLREVFEEIKNIIKERVI